MSAQHVAKPGQFNFGASHADEVCHLGRDLLGPMLTKTVAGKLEQAADAVLPPEPELALAPQAFRLVFRIDAGLQHLENGVVVITHGSGLIRPFNWCNLAAMAVILALLRGNSRHSGIVSSNSSDQ